MIWIAYGVELEPQRPDPFASAAGTGDSKWGNMESDGTIMRQVYMNLMMFTSHGAVATAILASLYILLCHAVCSLPASTLGNTEILGSIFAL